MPEPVANATSPKPVLDYAPAAAPGGLLATRRGRLAAFFLLYVTEGIPLGFTAVAIAAEMRRQGVGAAAVTGFVASLYLPWSFKWAVGPFVDALYSERLGRRRGWILGCQLVMAVTLLAAVPVDYVNQLGLFTAIILLHNLASATQDVAIDALAVTTLRADERGLGNGLMFAGQYIGVAVGGSGTLLLSPLIGFRTSFFLTVAAILAVMFFVTRRLREPGFRQPGGGGGSAAVAGNPLAVAAVRVGRSTAGAVRAFFATRSATVALVFALLPAGALSLSLLGSTLSVELGLSQRQIGLFALASTVLSAGGCVLGGLLSDRFGRRRMIALYIAATTLPTLVAALYLQRHGWVLPVRDLNAPGRPPAPGSLVRAYVAAGLAFSFFQGLMYGTRTALFMDVVSRAVAATQFTAYMSLMNFVTFYSGMWQGRAAERIGYPLVLTIDAAVGCASLALLPWLRPVPQAEEVEPPVARGFEPVLDAPNRD